MSVSDPSPSNGKSTPGDSMPRRRWSAVTRQLENRPELLKILGNTGWIAGENLLRMGLGLALWIWIARFLGPEQYGLLTYATALVALAGPLASLGLEEVGVRELVRRPEQRGTILGTIAILKLIGGVVASLAAIAAVFVLNPDDSGTHVLVVVLALMTLFRFSDAFDLHFKALVQAKYVAWARGSAFLLLALGRIGLILAGASLATFALATTLEAVVAALLLTGFFFFSTARQPKLQARPLLFSTATARGLLRDSWPLIFSTAMIMIYLRIDQVMLRQMVNANELGRYAVAVSFSEAWLFVPMAIVSSTLPKIVEAQGQSEALFLDHLQKLFNTMAWLGYLAAIGFLLVAEPMLHFFYGAQYAGAGKMLMILGCSGVFAALGVARTSYLTTLGWTRFHLFSVTLGCVVNIAANFLLIPRWHGLGAAFATVIAQATAAYFSCFLHRPLWPIARMLSYALLPLPILRRQPPQDLSDKREP